MSFKDIVVQDGPNRAPQDQDHERARCGVPLARLEARLFPVANIKGAD